MPDRRYLSRKFAPCLARLSLLTLPPRKSRLISKGVVGDDGWKVCTFLGRQMVDIFGSCHRRKHGPQLSFCRYLREPSLTYASVRNKCMERFFRPGKSIFSCFIKVLLKYCPTIKKQQNFLFISVYLT